MSRRDDLAVALAFSELVAWQGRWVAAELAKGEPFFLGFPDRWYEKPGPKWRCPNDHVSERYLKSEHLGRPACLACMGPLALTHPEDADGPRREP